MEESQTTDDKFLVKEIIQVREAGFPLERGRYYAATLKAAHAFLVK